MVLVKSSVRMGWMVGIMACREEGTVIANLAEVSVLLCPMDVVMKILPSSGELAVACVLF